MAEEDPYGILKRLVEALPPGGHLVMTHATGDHLTPDELAAAQAANERSGVPFQLRSRAEIERFFRAWRSFPPGVTSVVDWRPDEAPGRRPAVEDVLMLGAVARVP